ncbi:hypothetical protein IFO69_09140 [Echinicola sp. CAU 1574]|uniref:Uncharacterized protein n=1 Tax=Echinicola arenosa TaxID=2774144 RepID=A0ABR9AJA1_9BACT|nr:hypothetical protein [Echinicola arenosa]MBD8488907.1 hypothetical protein [Echinicola arenosa]
MSSFELKSDSTAIVFWGEREVEGKWRWKYSKEFGNNTFGFSMSCDLLLVVFIGSGNMHIKDFQLGKKNEALILRVGDEDYKKE